MPAQAGTHALPWSVAIERVHAEAGVDPDLRRDDELGGDAATWVGMTV